jgi:hypothetical protein
MRKLFLPWYIRQDGVYAKEHIVDRKKCNQNKSDGKKSTYVKAGEVFGSSVVDRAVNGEDRHQD